MTRKELKDLPLKIIIWFTKVNSYYSMTQKKKKKLLLHVTKLETKYLLLVILKNTNHIWKNEVKKLMSRSKKITQ